MAPPDATPRGKRAILARVVGGLWAVNFFLLITETFTFRGQSQLSIALAIATIVLLFPSRS